MRSSHVIATLDVNSTVAYLVDIVVASPYTGLVVAQFAGYHGGPVSTVTLIFSLMWKYAKHPDGPCTQMGVGISTKGGAVTPAWFL